MQRIQKSDGTFFTDEEIIRIQNALANAGTPIGEYLEFNELEEIFLPIPILNGAFIEISKAEVKENEIVFELKYRGFIFASKEVYPLSKEMDKKNEKKVSAGRLMTFLEWQIAKNIDKIEENEKKVNK